MKLKNVSLSLLIAGLCGTGFAAQNILAEFAGVAPTGPSQAFQVQLHRTGDPALISAYGFRVAYDSTQVALGTSVSDNTGQPVSGAGWDVGPVTAANLAAGTDTYRNVIMTLSGDNLNSPTYLGLLNFTTTAGYTGPIKLHLELMPGEGLWNENGTNLAPTFDTTPVPVTVSGFTIE